MYQAGLRKKTIKVRNAPTMTDNKIEKHENRTLELYMEVQKVLDSKEHLVFVDESTFVARGFSTQAWSNRHDNIVVEDRTGKQPCQAICAAVCKCHGLLAYNIEDYSFSKDKFCGFLENLSRSVRGEKVYMFIDNCTIHHSHMAADKMKELKIIPIWNTPYRYDFNEAIEKYWA